MKQLDIVGAHAAGLAAVQAQQHDGQSFAQRATTHGNPAKGTGNSANATIIAKAEGAKARSYFPEPEKQR